MLTLLILTGALLQAASPDIAKQELLGKTVEQTENDSAIVEINIVEGAYVKHAQVKGTDINTSIQSSLAMEIQASLDDQFEAMLQMLDNDLSNDSVNPPHPLTSQTQTKFNTGR
ncbi:hypothetical protein [Shewanella sp. UCD-KL12]|uniref:hypothetical protein n=1 Tax=Shewanella sp. UCD-KL12 TaxID=1917163 RepID=UPI0009703BB0|nr:hypothetical protein [Shewanella sp. UCD-KL12]